MKKIKKLNNCRICNSKNLETVLKLRDTPLEDQYLKKKFVQPTYPLELVICKNCDYVFLLHVISPDISYENYIYESSVTVGLENHYDEYADEIVKSNDIGMNSLAVDIGSNDGSMLKSLKKQQLKVLGIEPAKKIALQANLKQFNTINAFFNSKLAKKIVKEKGLASIITANYMFANIDDLDDYILGVKILLKENGVFCIQTGYHPLQFSINMFDYIYHEHFSYFTLSSLKHLFDKHAMVIINASTTKPKGGSLRITVKNKNQNHLNSKVFNELYYNEQNNNYNTATFFHSLNKRIEKEKNKLISELIKLKRNKIKIAALGASHSTTTLLYHFEIHKYLDFIIDENEKKHNTFSPGHHIKVYNKTKLTKENIKCLLILAWQHQDTIIKKFHDFIENDGVILVPLPKFKILKK